jgi:hypothetical protein
MKPLGSRPGRISLAITPAIRPTMIQLRVPTLSRPTLPQLKALGTPCQTPVTTQSATGTQLRVRGAGEVT